MIWAAGALTALIYTANIPIFLALAARLGTAYGMGISAFWPGGAVLHARRRAAGIEEKSALRSFAKPSARAMWDIVQIVRKHTKLIDLELTGQAHLGDAMLTALAFGILVVARESAYRASSGRVRLNAMPNFTGTPANMEVSGIFALKLGHVIMAAVRFAVKTRKEKKQANGKASD